MPIKKLPQKLLTEAHVTPEHVYHNRRSILKNLGLGLSGLSAAGLSSGGLAQNSFFNGIFGDKEGLPTAQQKPLNFTKASPSNLEITPEEKSTSYNNFYEFGVNKNDPARNAQRFKVEPWTLKIEGEVNKPTTVDIWDLIHSSKLQERIYRFRCVEAWSMVIPWLGFELGDLIKQAEPNSKAKYVAFETLHDPKQMPGQASRRMGGGIDYPYVEGLRLDEAMHPLTIMAVGMYGKTLPPQNGAPIRLMSPWKYGFKAIKSIVKIKLVEKMPPTTWNLTNSREYGFYANVNPDVDHPRWSQASERFIGDGGAFSSTRQETLFMNGYAEEVAHLYSDMDLRKRF